MHLNSERYVAGTGVSSPGQIFELSKHLVARGSDIFSGGAFKSKDEGVKIFEHESVGRKCAVDLQIRLVSHSRFLSVGNPTTELKLEGEGVNLSPKGAA